MCLHSCSACSSPLFSDILGMCHYIFISSLKRNTELRKWRTVEKMFLFASTVVVVCFCSNHQSHFLADGGAWWVLNLLPAYSSYCSHEPLVQWQQSRSDTQPNVICNKKPTLLKFTLLNINMINSLNSVVNLTCVSILCKLDCHVRLLCNRVTFFFFWFWVQSLCRQFLIECQLCQQWPEVDSLLTFCKL